jgi:Tol biopolymer transport system component
MRWLVALVALAVACGARDEPWPEAGAHPPPPAPEPEPALALASAGPAGAALGAATSGEATLSGDGRLVVFHSDAPDLVEGDGNGTYDVFVHDIELRVTRRVSVGPGGAEARGGPSLTATISASGRFVAFHSQATNLVPDDGNGQLDVFVHDLMTGTTSRASVASDGSEGRLGSALPALDAEGRFVAFQSDAPNLVPGDTNQTRDVFVHDRLTGATSRVNVASDGTQSCCGWSGAAALSADGMTVAFHSDAPNLVPGDGNGERDVFVHDRRTGATTRVSVASDGAQAVGGGSWYPALSADGRFVAFHSYATNLVPGDRNGGVDVFVHDRQTRVTTRVSVASDGTEGEGGGSGWASISRDGRLVAFSSYAPNLVPGDGNGKADVFVHDRATGVTTRVSVAGDGREGAGGDSAIPAISGDGRAVAFESAAALLPGVAAARIDVFVARAPRP